MAQNPTALSQAEMAIWEQEWSELISVWTREQQGERIRSVFERNKGFIRAAAGIAKSQFRQEAFNGIDAQGGFGWGLLRPQHLLRSTTGTTAGTTASSVGGVDWSRLVTATGWNFYIGTSTVFNQINRRATVLLLGLVNHNPIPKSTAMQLQISGITYPPWDLYHAMKYEGGVRTWAFPKPKLIPQLEQLKIQMFDTLTGGDEPQILGIIYAESGYLQLQQPALEAP